MELRANILTKLSKNTKFKLSTKKQLDNLDGILDMIKFSKTTKNNNNSNQRNNDLSVTDRNTSKMRSSSFKNNQGMWRMSNTPELHILDGANVSHDLSMRQENTSNFV